jgi:hypothetical protein
MFVVSPFSAIASLLLQSPIDEGLPLSVLKRDWLHVSRFGLQLGLRLADADLFRSDESAVNRIVDHHLLLHKQTVETSHDGRVRLRVINIGASSPVFDSALLARASKVMELAIYRNQILHFFVDACLLVRIISSTAAPRSLLFAHHARLRRLLRPDFLFDPEAAAASCDAALNLLGSEGILLKSDEDQPLYELNRSQPLTHFLDLLIAPFLQAYYLSYHFVLEMTSNQEQLQDPKSTAKLLQSRILALMLERSLTQYDMLSLDTLSNACQSLVLVNVALKTADPLRLQGLDIVDVPALIENLEFLKQFVHEQFIMETNSGGYEAQASKLLKARL